MAARGTLAKINVENKLREAFGENFLGSLDKKLYVLADDGDEKVQIAIALTCPKTGIDTFDDEPQNKNNFIDSPFPMVNKPAETAIQMTPDEEKTISELLAKLGL